MVSRGEAVAIGIVAILIAVEPAGFTLPTFIVWRQQLNGARPDVTLVYVQDKKEFPVREEVHPGSTQIRLGDRDVNTNLRGVPFRVALVGTKQPLADGQVNVFIAEPEPTIPMNDPQPNVVWIDAGADRSLLPGVPYASADGDMSGYLLQTPASPTGEGLRSLYDFTLGIGPELSRTTLVITVTGTNVPVVPIRTYAVEFN